MIEKMYVNKKNKLTYRARLQIAKQYNYCKSATKLAQKNQVSRQTIYNVLRRFEQSDVYGLEDHRPGARRETLNPIFYANIVDLRKRNGWGACRIERYFRKLGFSVGHNKINSVIQVENLTNIKLGKTSRPKYISYEAEKNNDQWHMDWSIDPISKKNLLAIIDDKSRFIVYAGLFESASAENSALGLYKAIITYGAPKELVTDNGSHFKNIAKKMPNAELMAVEEKYGIHHIFITPGYPQANGKIERFFGSYKGEFPIMHHPDVHDCLTWVQYYNFERIHQSLDYDTPAQRYLIVK
jgi:transposase InsO family protein